jgi:hypothetical protein
MGTLTVTFATSAATVFTRNFAIPDADLNRIVAAYQNGANGALNGTATPQQVATFIVQGWINEMANNVISFGTQAALAAVAPIAPISAV